MTSISITKGTVETPLYLKMLNRNGLIAGATGTGKTVTLKVITEKLSQQGIPVFLADIKGDLSGLAKPGQWLEYQFGFHLNREVAPTRETPCPR